MEGLVLKGRTAGNALQPATGFHLFKETRDILFLSPASYESQEVLNDSRFIMTIAFRGKSIRSRKSSLLVIVRDEDALIVQSGIKLGKNTLF